MHPSSVVKCHRHKHMRFIISKIDEVIFFGDDVSHSTMMPFTQVKSAGTVDIRLRTDKGCGYLAVEVTPVARTLSLDAFPMDGVKELINAALGINGSVIETSRTSWRIMDHNV